MNFLDTSSLLQSELEWLQKIMQFRSRDRNTDVRLVGELQLSPIQTNETIVYTKIINENKLTFEDRLLLILALTPVIAPQFLDRELLSWRKSAISNEIQPIWGLIYGSMYSGILPTAQFFLYLLLGEVFDKRLVVTRKLLNYVYKSMEKEFVVISIPPVGEPALIGILTINEIYLNQFID
jgi:hypothetical protein